MDDNLITVSAVPVNEGTDDSQESVLNATVVAEVTGVQQLQEQTILHSSLSARGAPNTNYVPVDVNNNNNNL